MAIAALAGIHDECMGCPPEDACSSCFDLRHAIEHPEPVEGCFACKLDTIQVGAALHATRATKYVPPRRPDNPWERGRAGEHRPDGSFMPYLKSDLSPMGVKEFADNRTRCEEQIRRYKSGHAAPPEHY